MIARGGSTRRVSTRGAADLGLLAGGRAAAGCGADRGAGRVSTLRFAEGGTAVEIDALSFLESSPLRRGAAQALAAKTVTRTMPALRMASLDSCRGDHSAVLISRFLPPLGANEASPRSSTI